MSDLPNWRDRSLLQRLESLQNDLALRLRRKFSWVRLRRAPPRPRLNAGELAFYRLLLERALPAPFRQQVSEVIDVGCRNWSYLPALAEGFPQARLHGVEVDGSWRHWDLHRRQDYAEAYAALIRAKGRMAQWTEADFRRWKLPPTDLRGRIAVLFFYPFVSADPCLDWGLPLAYVDFAALLEKARSEVTSLGRPLLLLSVHQGEWELELAREAYRSLNLVPEARLVEPREFEGLWPAPYPVWILFKELDTSA